MLTISPGHWHVGTGARGLIDEVTEARKVVTAVSHYLRKQGVAVHTVVDTRSQNQQENVRYLVKAHNATRRQLDVSVHFNAVAGQRQEGIGTEVLYRTEANLAKKMSAAIAKAAGLKNRGAKQRHDIAFLNGVTARAILIEVCFVNSVQDVARYQQYQTAIVQAIAGVVMQELK